MADKLFDITKDIIGNMDIKDPEMKYSPKFIESIAKWIHSPSPFDYGKISISKVYKLLRFAHYYSIASLTKEIIDYYKEWLDSDTISMDVVSAFLVHYARDGIGKDLYDKAINDIVWTRKFLCSFEHKNCTPTICDIEEELNACTEERAKFKRISDNYMEAMRLISLPIYRDIEERYVSSCI